MGKIKLFTGWWWWWWCAHLFLNLAIFSVMTLFVCYYSHGHFFISFCLAHHLHITLEIVFWEFSSIEVCCKFNNSKGKFRHTVFSPSNGIPLFRRIVSHDLVRYTRKRLSWNLKAFRVRIVTQFGPKCQSKSKKNVTVTKSTPGKFGVNKVFNAKKKPKWKKRQVVEKKCHWRRRNRRRKSSS